jgi:hypothetical protein
MGGAMLTRAKIAILFSVVLCTSTLAETNRELFHRCGLNCLCSPISNPSRARLSADSLSLSGLQLVSNVRITAALIH